MKRILIATASLVAIQCGSSLAADLPTTKAPLPVLASPSTWTGVYIGINGGYGGNDLTSQNSDYLLILGNSIPSNAISNTRTSRVGGAVAGGQVGYNYVFSNHVLVGGEFDFDWSDMKGKDYSKSTGAAYDTLPILYGDNFSQTAGLNWIGTARLRLGYEMGALLPYVTGGVAFGQASASNSVTALSTFPTGFQQNGNNSSISPGWAVGAGLEYKLAKDWSFKTEYLYTQIGSISTNTFNVDESGEYRFINTTISSIGMHQVRVGINYHPHFFDAPVMAKY